MHTYIIKAFCFKRSASATATEVPTTDRVGIDKLLIRRTTHPSSKAIWAHYVSEDRSYSGDMERLGGA